MKKALTKMASVTLLFLMLLSAIPDETLHLGRAEGSLVGSEPVISAIVSTKTEWTKYSGNPLNSLGAGCDNPWVIFNDGTYGMWLSKSDGIYYSSSADGISWIDPTEVLKPGASGSWETIVYEPCVVYDGTIYRMWYTGSYSGVSKIGYATSKDGTSWAKYSGNPVLVPGGNGGWDDWNLWGPNVYFDGSLYRMWYTAEQSRDGTRKIGMATSTDGVLWAKYTGNPVITLGTGWDSRFVHAGPVVKEGTNYKMWYTARDGGVWRVGLATSSDGIIWQKNAGNPIFNPGPDAWDAHSIIDSSVVLVGNTYNMWYIGSDGSIQKVGLASSSPYISPKEEDLEARRILYKNYAKALDGNYWVEEGINSLLMFGEDFIDSYANPFKILKRVATKLAIGDYNSAELIAKEVGALVSTTTLQSLSFTINWAYSLTDAPHGYYGRITNPSRQIEDILSLIEGNNYVEARSKITDLINYLRIAKAQVDNTPQLVNVKQTSKAIFESTIYFLQAEFQSLIDSGISVTLQENQHKLYLNVYDSQGRHVGFNPDLNQAEVSIPDASYLDLNQTTLIILPNLLTNFTCVVDACQSSYQTESYNITFANHKTGRAVYEQTEFGIIKKGEKDSYFIKLSTGSDEIQINEKTSALEFWYLLIITVVLTVPISAYLLLRRKSKPDTKAHESA
ncbi:MAG: hypothetical protein NWE95_01760 [Candidatus Bathyarchaeota archaeon]|nr:hypothetical protein [Candidatus Bathyarchaeota archaeon]